MSLTTDWMERIAKALHVTPTEIISEPSALRTVDVNMHVEAGVWSEAAIWEDPDSHYKIAVPNDPDFANYALHGAETRGPSMNKRYPEGTVVVYTSIYETEETPTPGRRYIIEREGPDGLREATVKTLHRDENGGLWLMPESDDPRHQQPIAKSTATLATQSELLGALSFQSRKKSNAHFDPQYQLSLDCGRTSFGLFWVIYSHQGIDEPTCLVEQWLRASQQTRVHPKSSLDMRCANFLHHQLNDQYRICVLPRFRILGNILREPLFKTAIGATLSMSL